MYEKKKKSGFQKFTMFMVWIMIVITVLGVILSAASALQLI
ncbi:DUF4044 domain-containing protein [Periweissella beninensis]|uniref:DUF4044 domain-containing protein n=1 Tax=Periweissella beninensis TaxID=504936 RepID=A0ABT0VKP1_9LACO|nr:DUF4044 domain-containing protein [Periweissella beninensis]MBM7544506.1 putative membrane protein affecting hemolysin expression [Periweissella beninensis]MCM2438004.1 DUF4044 domain-containing protein [Periweissella beninensis]MCT4396921.1 DUF4044 domain-containing protein [Periweissella beninensis]